MCFVFDLMAAFITFASCVAHGSPVVSSKAAADDRGRSSVMGSAGIQQHATQASAAGTPLLCLLSVLHCFFLLCYWRICAALAG
jgi:hypothetical protein